MAVVGRVGTPRPEIATHIAADEPLVAAVSHGHPLASTATITLKVLHDHPLISLPQGTGLRACIDDACAKAGFPPHIAIEASGPNVLAKFAGRSFGVAILPESIANRRTNRPGRSGADRPYAQRTGRPDRRIYNQWC